MLDKSYEPFPYSNVGLEGFLNAKLLVEIIRKMGKSIAREHVRKAAESIDEFDLGIKSPVTFRPDQHQGSDFVDFSTVEDGRYVRVTDWKKWRK